MRFELFYHDFAKTEPDFPTSSPAWQAFLRWLEKFDALSARIAKQENFPHSDSQWKIFREMAKQAVLLAHAEDLDVIVDIIKNMRGIIQFHGKQLIIEEEYNMTKKERWLSLFTFATQFSIYGTSAGNLCLELHFDLFK